MKFMSKNHKTKVDPEDSNKIVKKNYDPSFYQGKSQFEQGLAETHEQVSDDYVERTIDQKKNEKFGRAGKMFSLSGLSFV